MILLVAVMDGDSVGTVIGYYSSVAECCFALCGSGSG